MEEFKWEKIEERMEDRMTVLLKELDNRREVKWRRRGKRWGEG